MLVKGRALDVHTGEGAESLRRLEELYHEAIKPGRTDVKALSRLGVKVIKSCHKKQK